MSEPSKTDGYRYYLQFDIDVANAEDDPPYVVENLSRQEYIWFKNSDAHVLEYVKKTYFPLGGEPKSLYKSCDGVDYVRVRIGNPDFDPEPSMDQTPAAIIQQPLQTQQRLGNKLPSMAQSGTASTSNSNAVLKDCSNLPKSQIKPETNGRKSMIWEHVYQSKKEKDSVICKYCERPLKTCGNTTNVKNHLKNQHPFLFNESNTTKKANKRSIDVSQHSQPHAADAEHEPAKKKLKESMIPSNDVMITEAFQKLESFKDGGTEDKRITSAICFMISKDMLPPSLVEKEGFRNLMRVTKPLYKVPSKKTIMNNLEAKYMRMKQEFTHELEFVPWYCITTDKWTDRSNQSYMGVTIHYLDQGSMEMKNRVVTCEPLECRSDAASLEKCLREIFKEFNIKIERISSIVTDGEASLVKACANIVGIERHVTCAAHTAAHLIPDASKNNIVLKNIIEKVKSIVTLVRRSGPASKKLKKLQMSEGKEENEVKKLIQDCPTRWTSTVDMLERYKELEPFLYTVMAECEKPIDLLNRDELKILADVMPMMKSVTTVITEISGDTYPTASLIIPLFRCLELDIEKYLPETDTGKLLKRDLQAETAVRFEAILKSHSLLEATLLDPRFKKLHFKNFNVVARGFEVIKRKLVRISSKSTNQASVLQPDANKVCGKKSLWDHHEAAKEAIQGQSTSMSSHPTDLEVERYIAAPYLDRKENPLAYWQANRKFSPTLADLALKKVSALGTSVSSERLFSKAGNIKRDRRSRLSGKNLKILLFLGCLSISKWN